MSTFDLDSEVRQAMELKWNEPQRSDEQKIEEIVEWFKALPLAERKRMFNRIKSELKKLGFDEQNYQDLPY